MSRFARILTVIMMVSLLLGFMPTQTYAADSFPTNPAAFEQTFKVVNVDGGCYNTVMEPNGGFEGHGSHFLWVLTGLPDVGLVLHTNNEHYAFVSGQPERSGEVSGSNGNGHRYLIAPGQVVIVEVWGGCDPGGYGASLYPNRSAQTRVAPNVGSMSASFPRNTSDFMTQFQVENLGGCAVEPYLELGTGFEAHGDHFKFTTPILGIDQTFDLNKDHYKILSGSPERYGFTPGSNRNGERYIVKAGQQMVVEVWGGCGVTPVGYGFTVWPGFTKRPRED